MGAFLLPKTFLNLTIFQSLSVKTQHSRRYIQLN